MTKRTRQAKAVGSTKGKPETTETEFDATQPLDNPRHEAFAQAMAQGLKGGDAYRKVYGEHVKTPRSQASDLIRDNPDISLRIKTLQGRAASGAVMTLQQEMEYLTKAILTPLDQIDETSILCQSAKYSETGRELKMVDKLRALELLAKLKGEFAADRVEHSGKVELNVTMSEERRASLMERQQKALEAARN